MSTRSSTWFVEADGRFAPIPEQALDAYKVDARVYRHSDGYPEGHGTDLLRFVAEVESQCSDTRFNDPCYLAAKLVVYLAAEFARTYDSETQSYLPNEPLDFLSVGVLQRDPEDIEYLYVVDCSASVVNVLTPERPSGYPRVQCFEVEHPNGWDSPPVLGAECEIPAPEPADLEAVLAGYLECALWASTDGEGGDLDAQASLSDLSDEARASLRSDVVTFLERLAAEGIDWRPRIEPEQLGHDLWLTRNGHGAGFWDRGLGELGERLSDLARACGERYLYLASGGLEVE